MLKNKKAWLVIFLYGICSLVFHFCFVEVGRGDDAYFISMISQQTLGEFLQHRWNSWSSRLVIETVVVSVLPLPAFLWKILDVVISILTAYLFLSMIYYKKNAEEVIGWSGFLLFLYDFRELSSVGWMNTTIFYWWVLAAGMLACLPLYLHYRGEAVSPGLYCMAVPACVFAANQELAAVVLVCSSIYLWGLFCFEKRKVPKYLYVVLGIALVEILISFLCPGNRMRMKMSVEYWLPEFAELNLFQKGLLGWHGLLRTLFADINWLYFGVSGSLALAVLKKTRQWAKKLVGILPFAATIGQAMGVQVAFPLESAGMYLFYTAICLCFAAGMYAVWGKTKKFAHMFAILCIGTISKVSMGMSPTVWASEERTSIFFLFALLVIGICCIEELGNGVKR